MLPFNHSNKLLFEFTGSYHIVEILITLTHVPNKRSVSTHWFNNQKFLFLLVGPIFFVLDVYLVF